MYYKRRGCGPAESKKTTTRAVEHWQDTSHHAHHNPASLRYYSVYFFALKKTHRHAAQPLSAAVVNGDKSSTVHGACLQQRFLVSLESLHRRPGAVIGRRDRCEHAHDVRDLTGLIARHRVAPEVVAEGVTLR